MNPIDLSPKIQHNLSNYDKVKLLNSSNKWTSDGKGLPMKLSTDMPKTILKYSCTSFYSKRPKEDFTYSDLKTKVPNLLMSLKLKIKRGTCFSLTEEFLNCMLPL
jgi:hypothetical protein